MTERELEVIKVLWPLVGVLVVTMLAVIGYMFRQVLDKVSELDIAVKSQLPAFSVEMKAVQDQMGSIRSQINDLSHSGKEVSILRERIAVLEYAMRSKGMESLDKRNPQ